MRHTTIGVDVAKDHLDACRLPNREVRRFPNTKQGRDALVRWIGKGAERVVFEPTGHYARPLERKLHLAGLPAVKVNPARARRFAEAAGLLAKTDRIDAEMLARMGRQLDIAPTPPLSPDIETLKELRQALMEAELEIEGGASPRVSPFADLRDLGGLLQRAGFALPVADLDSLTLDYRNVFELIQDLRALGETNAVAAQRRGASRRRTLLRAAGLYQARHGRPDGRIPASFQVLYLTGWAPHASQQQPLAPGSARSRLAAALGAEEHSAGEPARPGPAGKTPKR